MSAEILRSGGNPDRIVDLLRADGGWMTVEQLTAEFADRWPDVPTSSMTRAFWRLGHRYPDLVELDWEEQWSCDGFYPAGRLRRVRRMRAAA